MKPYIKISIFLILTSCTYASCQTGINSKSEYISNIDNENILNYFEKTNFKRKFDSIKIHCDIKNKTLNNYTIEISFLTKSKCIKTELKRQGSLLHNDDNVYIDINNNIAYIIWISEPFYNDSEKDPKHSFDLHMKALDLGSCKVIFDEKLYSTKCCIDRLEMIFNPFTSSILITYNDFSKDNSKYLMYGFIKINKNNLPDNDFTPIEIILEDKSEKGFPKFIKNDKNIYLHHSSGENWGLFEHTGKSQVGISIIDSLNSPTKYKIIRDKYDVENNLLLIEDTIYFRVRVENNNELNMMRIKKIKLSDLEND